MGVPPVALKPPDGLLVGGRLLREGGGRENCREQQAKLQRQFEEDLQRRTRALRERYRAVSCTEYSSTEYKDKRSRERTEEPDTP
jgi:hypothetical protein